MSASVPLRSLLADPAMACAGYVAERERAEYLYAAEVLGFAVASIDLEGCTDKEDALARFARALRFPDWFGGNWDAFSDCLADLSWMPADGYLLLLEHATDWRDADATAFGIALELLEQASEAWRSDRVPFWALMPVDDPFAD
jgi:RNAse (barnase) inhibitor barstar